MAARVLRRGMAAPAAAVTSALVGSQREHGPSHPRQQEGAPSPRTLAEARVELVREQLRVNGVLSIDDSNAPAWAWRSPEIRGLSPAQRDAAVDTLVAEGAAWLEPVGVAIAVIDATADAPFSAPVIGEDVETGS